MIIIHSSLRKNCGEASVRPHVKIQVNKAPVTSPIPLIKLHLVSINVRGLNHNPEVGPIRDYSNSLTPKINVLCLQEQNYGGTK